MTRLEYSLNRALPPLAWVASLSDANQCSVTHGPLVETGASFFFEGAWAGEFLAARPDQTEVVFGSGGTALSGGVTFVTSLATTDYLYYRTHHGVTTVANSLALLLAATDDALDPGYLGYAEINNSILSGTALYERRIPTRRGFVRRVMHANLVVEAGEAREVAKPEPPDFSTYSAYYDYLQTRYATLVRNARDGTRRNPLRIFSTQSRGYDSTAINAIAASHGLDGVFTIRTGKGGGSAADDPNELEVSDDGTEIAQALGLAPVIGLERRAFAKSFDDELYYHAAIHECQDANFKQLSERIDAPALLLTGILGELWYTRSSFYEERPDFLGADLRKADLGGHGLGEVRLRAGYVQAALPFIGARRRAQILALTESAEMSAWRLGVAYDRPLPRRIGEEAGVPRLAFGQVKIGSVVEFAVPQAPQTAALRSAYFNFLLSAGLLTSLQIRLYGFVRRFNEMVWFTTPTRHRFFHYVMRLASKLRRREIRIPIVWNRLRGSLFCFAVNECVKEYLNALSASHQPGSRESGP
jgi:hypothetical protein